MSEKFDKSSVVEDFCRMTYDMWQKGWDEANGGNISYLLTESELDSITSQTSGDQLFYLEDVPEIMVNKYLLISASGSQFRTLKHNPSVDAGLIKLEKNGFRVVDGFETGKRPTSEIYMHVLAHATRLEVDPLHRVVVHNHANNATALTLVVEPADKDYTFPLWQVLTESIVVFPDGVGVLPWQLPGTKDIGLNTAEKLRSCRIVVWAFHGILATGKDFQDCFGLIETVDKAAEIYINTLNLKNYQGLNNEQLLQVCQALNVNPRLEWFE